MWIVWRAKERTYDGPSLRRLNLYGTHNIYSILDDLSINHSESETFQSPLVRFALDRLSEAENGYFHSKFETLRIYDTKLAEIYGMEMPGPEASKREKRRQEKKILNRFRDVETENKTKYEVKYANKDGDVILEPTMYTPNQAAKVYLETLDPTNHRGLETMGIMERVSSLKEKYKTFEDFAKSPEYKELEIEMVGANLPGLRVRTVDQAINAVNRLNRLALEKIQEDFDNKVISSKAKKAKEKIQDSKHTKAIGQIVKQAKAAYERDAVGGYELTSKGEAIMDIMMANGPELKQLADYIVDEFFPQYSHGTLYEGHVNLDKVFRDTYGFSLPRNPKYSPVMRVEDMTSTVEAVDLLTPERVLNGMTNSHFKEKGNNAQELAQQDIQNMVMRFIHKMEYFKAYQKALTDLNNVFNNKEVRDKISNDFGPEYHKALIDNIRGIAGKETEYNEAYRIAHAARANYVTGSLAAKPSLALKQLTSFMAYGADMPVVDFVKGMKDMLKYNPDAKEIGDMFPEYKEAYNTLMNLDFMKKRYARLEFDDAVSQMVSPAELARVPSKRQYFTRRITNSLMSPVIFGDRNAIIFGGWPKYKYEYNKALKEGKSESEARRIAEKEFEASTRFAQQASEKSDLSLAQKNAFFKMFTMYATTPFSYYRQARGAARAFSAGKGSPLQNAKKFAIYHSILPLLFQGATNAWKRGRMYVMGEDEELDEALRLDIDEFLANPNLETWSQAEIGAIPRSYARALVVGSNNGIFGLGGMIVNGANYIIEEQNYDYQLSPITGAVGTTIRSGGQLINFYKDVLAAQEDITPGELYEAVIGWEDHAEKWGKFLTPVGQLGFGIPMSGMHKAIEPLWKKYRREELDGRDPSERYNIPIEGHYETQQ